MYRPYLDPPPPLGGAVGLPRRAQRCVAASGGPQATRTQGQLQTQGNVPYVGLSIYIRFPVLSLTKCRPLLTMRGGYDMEGRPWSPYFHHWSGGPLSQRGLSGHWTLPEGGSSLATRKLRNWHRNVYWLLEVDSFKTINFLINLFL